MDHIVKERYPTFSDALRDLDDALSLLFLFANLPSTSTVPPKTIALCSRLCREFEHYLITTNSLRKSFLSIKGIYYQATVQGQDILWLVPYKFVQRVTGDVDFRIMGTFVEFYTTLLSFVNFRLYTSIGLVYPPRFDAKSDELGGELSAIMLEGKAIEEPTRIEPAVNGHVNGVDTGKVAADTELQKKIAAIEEAPDPEEDARQDQPQGADEKIDDSIDIFEATAENADVLPQPEASSNEAASLFAPFTFFLSRETPRQPLEFLLRAFGCKRIGWDAGLGDGAFTNNEADPTITHQIVDRPPLASPAEAQISNGTSDASATQIVKSGYRMPGRTYVQPQWVWDSVNGVKLLRSDLYAPGATLPPHLSPWVKPTKGTYDPCAPLAEQEREGEAEEAEDLNEDEEDGEEESDDASENGAAVPKSLAPPVTVESQDDHGMDVADSESEPSDNESATSAPFAGFDSPPPESDPEADPVLSQHQRELEAEAAGLTYSDTFVKSNGTLVKGILKPSKGDEARRKAARKRREEEEELERRKMMMGRKKRKVLDKMLYSNKQKDAEAEKLRSKRRKIEGRKG